MGKWDLIRVDEEEHDGGDGSGLWQVRIWNLVGDDEEEHGGGDASELWANLNMGCGRKR